MAKTYIKLWESYESYFEPLGAAEVGRLVLAMMQYKSSGVEPEFSGSEKFIWPAIKRDLDEDIAYTARQAKHEKASRDKRKQASASESKRAQADASENTPEQAGTRESQPIRNKDIGRRNKDAGEGKSPSRPASGKGGAAALPTPDELEARFGSRELAGAICDWIAYKQERRDGYKPVGLKSLMTQIENQAKEHGARPVADVIRLSMSNGWKGIIWERMQAGKPDAAADDGLADWEREWLEEQKKRREAKGK